MSYFWDRVSIGGLEECWEWKQSTQSAGYGQIGQPQALKRGLPQLAHRAAYWLTRGELSSLPVLHSCDNRRCCNPTHLRQGTYQENMKDKDSRGKQPRGDLQYNSKLCSQDVLRLKENPGLLGEIQSEKKVSRKALTDVLKGRTWKHI